MDALNFLKFWRHVTITASTVPHLLVETDNGSDEEDSFFDLELTVHDFDYKENNNFNNKIHGSPEDKTMRESEGLDLKQEGPSKMVERAGNGEVDISKTALPLSPNEPISKRKILPIEPISKPQSPIALLKSAPSFRISMFKKPKGMAAQKTGEAEWDMDTHKQKKETKFFAVKLNIEESHCSRSLSRENSSRSYGSKLRTQGSEEAKSDRFSKDVLHKYLKLIKPLYLKVSKRYNSDKMKFSGELSSASPMSSPSASSVSSSRKEKQGNIPAGIRVMRKHLGKSKSASAATVVASPANRSDDTLLQQHDGIQSAILHCKRSFNSRDSCSSKTSEKSMHSQRKSSEEENGSNI